jgi:hypothetical protein
MAQCNSPGHSGQMHSATLHLDHEEHIQPGQADRLHRQEVTRQRSRRLRAEEPCPGGTAAARCRAETVPTQDAAHRPGGDADAQLAALTDDSQVAPAGVVPGQLQHQLDHRRVQPSTPARCRIGPASTEQLTVPPQQRRRGDQEYLPPIVGQQLRQRCQDHPIGRGVAGPGHLSAKHGELVAQHRESRRGESHPPPLAEPCVSLSAYTAPMARPAGVRPKRQWANSRGERREASAISSRARCWRRRSRLYLRMAQRTR